MAEYARSCIYIAEHQLNRGTDIDELVNARELAESVAKSNSEHADHATELEKKMENEIWRRRDNQQLEYIKNNYQRSRGERQGDQ